MQLSRHRKPALSTDHLESVLSDNQTLAIGSDGSALRMSLWSHSMSMSSTAHRTGTSRYIASKGNHKLFLGEHQPEVLRVDFGVASIPLFGVDVPSSS